MQLPTVKVDRDEATRRFREYRRAVRARHSAEDEAMMRAYSALARGDEVLALTDAIRRGGIVEIAADVDVWRDGRYVSVDVTAHVPRVAIARADTHWCWTFGIRRDGSVHLRTQHRPHQRNKRDRFDLPAGTFEANEDRPPRIANTWDIPGLRSMVPSIPPALRPPGKLDRFHILYEAEWERDRAVPPAPADPALLRHLGGDLYSVIAVWDLTLVEQLVLTGRPVTDADRGPGQ